MHIFTYAKKGFEEIPQHREEWLGKKIGGYWSQWKIFHYLIVFEFIFYTLYTLMLS